MAEIMLKKLKDFAPEDKIPPQLAVIMAALGKYANGVERVALGKEIEADLKTRQGADKVIQFYQKRMETSGCVQVTKIGAEKKEKLDADGKPIPPKATPPKKSGGKQPAQTDSVAA